jgi:hypothetical protein
MLIENKGDRGQVDKNKKDICKSGSPSLPEAYPSNFFEKID